MRDQEASTHVSERNASSSPLDCDNASEAIHGRQSLALRLQGCFGHSGDLGDIIYAMPTIRASGGGVLYLYHIDGKTWHGMDTYKATNMRQLLIFQDYIHEVIFCPGGPPAGKDHALNEFRRFGRPGRNLADMHLATHHLDSSHRDAQWIKASTAIRARPVIFARSTRCLNPRFPWKSIWEAYHHLAGFVGSTEEHERFCENIGSVPRIHTEHLGEVANVIEGCDLFVGNQSCPAAIAEGLKHRMILETFPRLPNCRFDRPGRLDDAPQTFTSERLRSLDSDLP